MGNTFWRGTLGGSVPSDDRVAWLRWLLPAFAIALLGATRALWLNFGTFPQVPWFAWGCWVPHGVDFGLLVIVAAALIAVSCAALGSRLSRDGLWLFVGAMTGLLLLDQHRAQPWAYQFVLTAFVLAAAPARQAVGLLRLLTISIYLHSAVSKCDYSFCEGLGRSFLMELCNLVWEPPPVGALPWPTNAWPLLFPLGELLIAVGLIWPRSRRCALWVATGMHLLLLVVLGPWGLKHSWGVLIWNVYFIAQNFLLFSSNRHNSVNLSAPEAVVDQPATRGQIVATALIVWVALWPCLEPWGYCDLWPAWGLYAQHGEQLKVWVSDDALHRLPPNWRASATRSLRSTDDSWEWQLRPQTESLKATAAPVYPQNRFQLGVVLNLARKADIPSQEISAEWFFPANRWTGARHSIRLNTLKDMERAADRCWVNARPRN
jgi:hypothetical protein